MKKFELIEGKFYKIQRKTIFFFMILIYVMIMAGSIFYDDFFHEINGSAKIENGTIDLYEYDLNKGERVVLDGDWEFFWKKFIITDRLVNERPDFMIKVPDSWENYQINGEYLTGGGYASYKIRMNSVKDLTGIVCYVQNLGCAYRVFIDNRLVARSGDMSKYPDGVFVESKITLYPDILFKGESAELVVEVASNSGKGLYMVPTLAENYIDENYRLVNNIAGFIMVGMLIFCFIIYVVLCFTLHIKEYSRWLPFLFLVISLRTIISTEQYGLLQGLYKSISYEHMEIPICICTGVIKLLLMMYIRQTLNLNISKKSVVGFNSYYLFLFLIYLFGVRNPYGNYVSIGILMAAGVLDIYLLYMMYGSVKRGVPSSLWLTAGYFISLAGLNWETLYFMGVLKTNNIFAYTGCFLAFALITLGIYGHKIAQSHEKDIEILRMKEQVTQGRVELMLSQIRPHFLYNTLNTIGYFCKTDPKRAELTVIKFSKYLRANMESMEKKNIPFSEELLHIKNYVEIEELRFGNRLKVEYKIETEDFSLPTLTVQPLMENAIKHGVTKKISGGTIILHTYESLDHYYIIVEDDGVGFDPSEEPGIGLKNISIRLESLLHASLKIESVIGKGTKATIALPKIKS